MKGLINRSGVCTPARSKIRNDVENFQTEERGKNVGDGEITNK